jgi:hypothetical protein
VALSIVASHNYETYHEMLASARDYRGLAIHIRLPAISGDIDLG